MTPSINKPSDQRLIVAPEKAVVEPAGSKGCNAWVHAVLRVEHHFRVPRTLQPLEEALPVVRPLSLPRENRRRELRGVANHDNHPVHVTRRSGQRQKKNGVTQLQKTARGTGRNKKSLIDCHSHLT